MDIEQIWKAFHCTPREHQLAFFFFFYEGYSRIPITEHLPQIPAVSRLCRPIETAELSGSSAHTVWNRFLRLGKTASQPAKIVSGQRAVTRRLSIFFTEPQFCHSRVNPSRCWPCKHTGASPANIITHLQTHNVHCYNDNAQSFLPIDDALSWVLCKWCNSTVTWMYITHTEHTQLTELIKAQMR